MQRLPLVALCVVLVGTAGNLGRFAPVVVANVAAREAREPDGPFSKAEKLPQLRLSLEQAYGADTSPEDAIIGGFGGVAVGMHGNVYVLDARRDRLVAFTGDGSVAWVAGRRGPGPGEFSGALTGLAFDGASSLYVSNRGGTSVDRWETNGDYMETHSVEAMVDRPSAMVAGFIGPSYLVLADRLRGGLGSEVFVVDTQRTDWVVVSEFEVGAGPDEVPEDTNTRVTLDVRVGDDSVLVGNFGTYEARAYDVAGSLRHVFSRDLETLEMPRKLERGQRSVARSFGFVSAPIPLGDGHWMTHVSWPSETTNVDAVMRGLLTDRSGSEAVRMMNSVDVFDPSGRLVASYVAEGEESAEGLPWAFGADMRLYTIASEPFPQVRRYRLEVED